MMQLGSVPGHHWPNFSAVSQVSDDEKRNQQSRLTLVPESMSVVT